MRLAGDSVDVTHLGRLDFAKGGGILPAIVQSADDGAVLMLGYMTEEALRATLERRRVVFFSRSKGRLWEKGKISGHSLDLVAIRTDCDRDALLIAARPRGPTCHLGTGSCFGDAPATALGFLDDLESVIGLRMEQRPEGSYTAKLLDGGKTRMAQKIGEEGLEVALASVAESDEAVVGEVADLLYHVMVMLKARGLGFGAVVEELKRRHGSLTGL
jgi:phosphoribosyl-AMP cyclohydrolase / phosphoribosyl-ATP pyrophosphohydrolase